MKIRYIALVVFSTAGALLLAFPDLVEYAIARGDTHRLEIWGTFLRDVAQAPIFGQGLITEVEYIIADDNFHSPHNAYIQALWHGGIIGLGLLLLLMASAFWQAWRLGNESGDYVVLSMLLFAAGVMFAAVDMLINRPRDQWMLFWFPLALLISYQTTGRQVERAGSRAMA